MSNVHTKTTAVHMQKMLLPIIIVSAVIQKDCLQSYMWTMKCTVM